jgi:hypothetical protein
MLVHPQPTLSQLNSNQKTTQNQKANPKQTKPEKNIKPPQPHKKNPYFDLLLNKEEGHTKGIELC